MAINFVTMRIAIYTGIVPAEFNNAYHHFTVETIQQLITTHKQHEFILLDDKPDQEFIASHSNCSWTYLQSIPDSSLLLKWWLNITVRGVLKKIKPDLFVSSFIVTAKPKMKQCLIVAGLQQVFPARSINKFFEKADAIVVSSAHIKKQVTEKYKLTSKKITTLPFNLNNKRSSLDKKRKPGIVEKISNDKLFFLAAAEQHITKELVNLLKAFSIFKKMQQSSMRLMISGKVNKDFQEQVNNYKYRDDVIVYMPSSFEEENELIAAAYAVLLPSGFDEAGVYCISAIQSGVPVVCMAGTASSQIAGNAALNFTSGNVSELASCIMELYKDENGRKKLIEKGNSVIEKLHVEKPEILLWQAIEKAMD
jgi:glycosyltransferase involved in cell wall biosynthesis